VGIFIIKEYIMKKIIRLTESDLTRIVKRVIMEEDCSKLIEIPKSGIKGLQGGGKPQSTTWKEDIAKIGNAGTTYMFKGPLLDAMNTQRKCHRAKTDVTYSEFKKEDGTFYTMIGID
jgi:hypothetical protein